MAGRGGLRRAGSRQSLARQQHQPGSTLENSEELGFGPSKGDWCWQLGACLWETRRFRSRESGGEAGFVLLHLEVRGFGAGSRGWLRTGEGR